jgi:hypothetical protein
MLEKRFIAVPNQYILADGSVDGILVVPDASLFKVKQEVYIGGNTLPNLNDIEVKRVISPTQIAIGPKKGNIDARSDLSAYTLAKNCFIAANEQKRPSVPLEEFTRAVYEEEPTVAQRTVLVDKYGRRYDNENPLPVNASVNIGDIQIEANGYDPTTPDSINATGSEDGTKTGIKHSLRVDSELDLRVGISDGANKAQVDSNGKVSVKDTDAQVLLTSILTQLLNGTLKVDDDATQILLTSILTQLQSNSGLSIGTEDGTPSGTQHVFVNNLRQMILASDDVDPTYTYADFGTKNQRIIRIEWTSAKFPGFTVRRDFNYILDGTRYRRTNAPWSII